jgi:transcriptional antiterminator RfaH
MWYVIQTKPSNEFRAQENLNRQGYEVYLPLIERERFFRGTFVIRKEPLFSRYLFVELNSNNQNFAAIRSTRGVSRMVSFGQNPSTVSDELVQNMKAIQYIPREKLFASGDKVKIFAGPLRGLEGVYQSSSGEESGIILLELLSKSQKVVIQHQQIFPLDL